MHGSEPLSSRRVMSALLVLWLGGNALRLTVLATPPVIPALHDDFHLSETEVGFLTGLVPVLFACAAVPGSLLIARLGAVRTLLIGLLFTAVGSALRGASPNVAILYLTTVAMGFGVAVMQPALPPLVREWLPGRVGFATAVYTNGLLVGEILPVALTIPLVLPLVGDSWRWAFVFWSVPVLAIAVAVVLLAPGSRMPGPVLAAGAKWWPNWRDPLVWRLGIMLGTVNAMYFTTNAFLPDYLNHHGRPDLISAALTALNLGQLPASFLLLAFAGRLERHYWPYIACGLIAVAGLVAIGLSAGAWTVIGAGLLGFSAAAVLVLMLALPPLLAPPDDVHRLSAAMFTISYGCAVVVPIVSGLAWDLSAIPATAFVPIGLSALLLVALAPTIDFSRRAR
jgi:CP family cyanate transporter-like MFS transporter